MNWKDIENNLESLVEIHSGFSAARRGIVTLPEGGKVFVKIGTDENTKYWAGREIATYHYLYHNNYPYVPKFIGRNEDASGFAIEALTEEDGWDWSADWTSQRLEKTLEAMDALAKLNPTGSDIEHFYQEGLTSKDDGWSSLRDSEAFQQQLLKKLCQAGRSNIAKKIDFGAEARRSASFVPQHDTLTHTDVRADNCAWNPKLQQAKLVDWNWAQMGDKRIDQAALLVHVGRARMDVVKDYASRCDASAVHWLAGFWLCAAGQPIWPGGPEHARDMQLHSGLTALLVLELLDKQ